MTIPCGSIIDSKHSQAENVPLDILVIEEQRVTDFSSLHYSYLLSVDYQYYML